MGLEHARPANLTAAITLARARRRELTNREFIQ